MDKLLLQKVLAEKTKERRDKADYHLLGTSCGTCFYLFVGVFQCECLWLDRDVKMNGICKHYKQRGKG